MTNLHHFDNLGTARFVTFSCYRRQPYLNTDNAKQFFIESLELVRKKHGFKLYGYVLMPEHVHLVLHPPDEKRLGLLIREIKSRAARAFFASTDHATGRTNVFWQRRCYDHNCRTVDTVREKIIYCHQNPVKRGLVDEPGLWRWSSYNWYQGERDVPLKADDFHL